MSNWQPIDTAPKDGTDILLFRSGAVHRGRWEKQRYHERPKPYWSDDLERGLGVIWCREHPPTHWMPLPEPPVE